MKDTQKQRDYCKVYYQKNKDKIKAFRKQYYYENIEKCRLYSRQYWKQNNEKIKREALIHYGNSKCACVWCGFNDIRALSLDHINGNGAEHRRQLKAMGIGGYFYKWLKLHSYPLGLQTLCMNCQFIKARECNAR